MAWLFTVSCRIFPRRYAPTASFSASMYNGVQILKAPFPVEGDMLQDYFVMLKEGDS